MQQRRAFGLLTLLLCFGAPEAMAEKIATAGLAASADELALTDGRLVRLDGILSAFPGGQQFLNRTVSNRELRLTNATPDRYGRLKATATVAGAEESLQESILKEGLAIVFPTESTPDVDRLFAAEQTARSAHRGYWESSTPLDAEKAEDHMGKYGIFTGTVSKTERIKNKIHVSFGDPTFPSLTILIAAKHLRPLKKRGIDALTLKGVPVRVRGWVENTETGRPAIVLTTPFQLGSGPFTPPLPHKSGEGLQTQD